jgi:hypothetical protein
MLGKFFLHKAFLLFLTWEFATCAENANGEFCETQRTIERSYKQMRVWMNTKWSILSELRFKVDGYYLMEDTFKKNIFCATSLPNIDSLIDYMEMLLHSKIELFIFFWGFFHRLENMTIYLPQDLGTITKVI